MSDLHTARGVCRRPHRIQPRQRDAAAQAAEHRLLETGLLGRLIAPAISEVFKSQFKAKARKLALAAVVEATRKRLETASLPEVPPPMPRDPFTEGDHSEEAKPLMWKQADGRLTVYSVGPDGEDDGGPPAPSVETPEGNDDVGLSIAL